jgi:IS1 family transposase
MSIMNRLSTAKRVAVLSALVEGCSIRSTVRMTGVAKGTILKLVADAGTAFAQYQDETLRNLSGCRHIQCDEIWAFVERKQKNIPAAKQGTPGIGDVWTWTAMCSDTKLLITWLVGDRDGRHACMFVKDLADRLTHRVQLTTDGLKLYIDAVEEGFGGDIDYAQLIKVYENVKGNESGVRYSPGEQVETRTEIIVGEPRRNFIGTSYVERQNLTARMNMRRFTRLTNGFSKKVANHAHAFAIFAMHYNFARRHQTLRVSPAMAAGVDRRLWTIENMVALIE